MAVWFQKALLVRLRQKYRHGEKDDFTYYIMNGKLYFINSLFFLFQIIVDLLYRLYRSKNLESLKREKYK